MYLFVFTALLVLFVYVNSNKALSAYDNKLIKANEKVEKYNDSIQKLTDEIHSLNYFSIIDNDDALSYFERFGYDAESLIPKIEDALISTNTYKGDQHPYVPFASMTDSRIMINKMRLLNHRWIIADFTDGKYWGEVFLTYEVINEETINFKLVEYLMYPPN
jgi:hypothetical protein